MRVAVTSASPMPSGTMMMMFLACPASSAWAVVGAANCRIAAAEAAHAESRSTLFIWFSLSSGDGTRLAAMARASARHRNRSRQGCRARWSFGRRLGDERCTRETAGECAHVPRAPAAWRHRAASGGDNAALLVHRIEVPGLIRLKRPPIDRARPNIRRPAPGSRTGVGHQGEAGFAATSASRSAPGP
jgi:hypothetical protein